MSNITFVIFVYNEERRIEYAIKNLKRYGDVIILDDGSTDHTKAIAERMGAFFYTRPANSQPYVETKEIYDFLLSILKTDWVYWGYVDNIIPRKTLEKMTEISNQNAIKRVCAPLYTYLWGDVRNYAQKAYIPILFHKDYIDFSNARIHSMGDFTGKPKENLMLPNTEDYAVKHFSVYDMKKFVMGHLRYAETEALEKFSSGKKFSAWRMIGAMIRYAWIYGRSSYRNGSLGLMTVMHYICFRLMAYHKLYELEHGMTLEKAEENYAVIKRKMLEDF